MPEEKITGTVEKITYSNPANSYTVAVVRSGKEMITVVGMMPFFLSNGTGIA